MENVVIFVELSITVYVKITHGKRNSEFTFLKSILACTKPE